MLDSIEASTEGLHAYDLQNQASHESMQEVFNVLEVGLERVSNIVKNMSIVEGSSHLHKRSYDINQCIHTVHNKLLKKLPSGVSISLELAKLPNIYIDTYHISQLLSNLLTNALAAVEGKGLITICSKQCEGQIDISVADNGCGIERHLQEQIFDPCYTTLKLVKSTGLGLAISRDIANEHGGNLCVNSTVGEGSVFTLTLPINNIIVH